MPALTGLRVIDLTRILAGPFCTQWLADHGAEVIKVEPPQGDDTRHWGPPFDPASGAASYFMGVNRNKRGIALDLRREEGRAVLRRLLARADVVIDNFKAGSMEAWGLGPDALQEEFPRLVQCRVTGFGADGPLGGLPGYDAVVQAQAGLMSVNGPESGEPTRLGIPLVDISVGMSSAIGILMALRERDVSGRGQFLDMTLYDAAVSILFPYGANYMMGGAVPRPVGNAHPNISPYETFPTRTVDIFVAAANDGQYRRLCDVLGCPELATDPRFETGPKRNGLRAELAALLRPRMAEWDGEELAKALMGAGVPAGPVMDVPGVLDHPHTKHRDMVVEIDGFRTLGNPIRMSRTPAEPGARRPPVFGQDTRAVLAESGYSGEEIEALLTAGAAFAAPV
ncbi:CaiB/BaiF CoA-transferase family protein [Oceanicella sp. SM1341]|uniref:CaiB/BaiF CoA transferase family protein n=1 Tax=Oceanicella sp. SM1341 TaxID=1548889 RepID=UPI000E529ED9|nr:CoA transferase [Oceanicella sp. SM1341]